jgi:rhamnogalacturonan acetylesterase
MSNTLVRLFLLIFWAAMSAGAREPRTVWLIGDSTVRNGIAGQLGWGTPLAGMLNPKLARVENRAIPGRSSRSFLEEGSWDKVLKLARPGDFVLIQFGHNDDVRSGAIHSIASLAGNGDDSLDGEKVRTYGWYIRNYVRTAVAARLNPVVISPVPRNHWKDGKVVRNESGYSDWAKAAAKQSGVWFLDLNTELAGRYDKLGEQNVRSLFAKGDSTHTGPAGASFTARCVMEGLKNIGCPLGNWGK